MSEPTKGPWQILQFSAPLDDWTHAQFVIRAPGGAPGGVAVVMGGLGLEEEKANARLIATAGNWHALMIKSLAAASELLRAYQHGGSNPELAKECADTIDVLLERSSRIVAGGNDA